MSLSPTTIALSTTRRLEERGGEAEAMPIDFLIGHLLPALSDDIFQVSKKINERSMASLTSLSLRRYKHQKGGTVDSLRAWAARLPGLQELSLADPFQVPIVFLEGLMQQIGPMLTSLDTRSNERINDRVISIIAKNCPQLIHLNVGGCRKITPDGFRHLLGVTSTPSTNILAQLESLSVRGLYHFQTAQAWDWIRACGRLRSLDMPGASVDEFGLPRHTLPMESLLSSLSALQFLYADRSGTWGLIQLVEKLPNLQVVFLKGTHLVVPDVPLGPTHGALRVLEVHGSQNLDDITLKLICGTCPNIEELSISDSSVTDAGFAALAGLAGLVRLEAKNLHAVSQATAQVFEACTRIQIVNLEGMTNVTDEGVRPLVDGLLASKMWTLNFAFTALTDVTVQRMAKNCGRVVNVSLMGLQTITVASVCQVIRNSEALRVLNVSLSSAAGEVAVLEVTSGRRSVEKLDISLRRGQPIPQEAIDRFRSTNPLCKLKV